MKELRIAVVGAGRMGRLHAQKVAALRDGEGCVSLAGIADLNGERARAIASQLGTRAAADGRELFADADAAIVAVPTVAHFDVVHSALTAGLDVLVEKPIAATLRQGEQMLALARGRGRVLQVGHLEWFNAAMRVVQENVRAPRFVEAQRMGPFPERGADVDVVRDLMIHDIDILQQLLGEEPARIEAVGVPVLRDSTDVANARIEFPSGCVANLTASRVSPERMRKVRLFQSDAYISIDLANDAITVVTREGEPGGESPVEIKAETLEFDAADALLAQDRDFVRAVAERGEPLVTGEDGLRALDLALRVMDSMPPLHELET